MYYFEPLKWGKVAGKIWDIGPLVHQFPAIVFLANEYQVQQLS